MFLIEPHITFMHEFFEVTLDETRHSHGKRYHLFIIPIFKR